MTDGRVPNPPKKRAEEPKCQEKREGPATDFLPATVALVLMKMKVMQYLSHRYILSMCGSVSLLLNRIIYIDIDSFVG